MIVGTGVLIGVVLYLSAPMLLSMLGAEGELAALAVQYVRVYALCSPVTTIVFAMDNYLRICGKVHMSMWLNIFMSVLTATLEFFFLFVLRWGIWGAALATCSGMFAAALVAILSFLEGKNAAALMCSKVSRRYGASNHCLRQSELFKQYCRACGIDPDECGSAAFGRR